MIKHDNNFNLLQLLKDSFEFYAQFNMSKAKIYKMIKNSFVNYKGVKYIQNLKHGAKIHYN